MNKNQAVTEDRLRAMFEENFERLRNESGHALSPDAKEAAWQQVRLYWQRLRHIAEGVTDTEVKLNLPNQKTRKGRSFCIEGVVDIVREAGKVTMYDIKTHDLDFVRANLDLYRDQLNVYAHIWQNLRAERLDETAIIATPVPEAVMDALRSGDAARIEAACEAWDPVVPIDFDGANVHRTIDEFADVVDCINEGKFRPPAQTKLREREGDRTFAARVCRDCDARFSCTGYRDYARRHKDRNWRAFADFYDLEPEEEQVMDRIEATLTAEEDSMRLVDGA